MREIPRHCSFARGMQFVLRRNRAEGLDLANALPFDAVMVDMMMRGVDGLHVFDELRKHRTG